MSPSSTTFSDDYDWTIASSPTTNPRANPVMNALFTEEQMRTKQIRMAVELLVRRSPDYVEIHENEIFRKVGLPKYSME